MHSWSSTNSTREAACFYTTTFKLVSHTSAYFLHARCLKACSQEHNFTAAPSCHSSPSCHMHVHAHMHGPAHSAFPQTQHISMVPGTCSSTRHRCIQLQPFKHGPQLGANKAFEWFAEWLESDIVAKARERRRCTHHHIQQVYFGYSFTYTAKKH